MKLLEYWALKAGRSIWNIEKGKVGVNIVSLPKREVSEAYILDDYVVTEMYNGWIYFSRRNA